MKHDKVIQFYSKKGDYGCFSNFYPSPFSVNKKLYRTVEHYFQSKKFEGLEQEQIVIDAPTPAKAFKLGRTKTVKRRGDWEVVKNDIMYEGLKYKFSIHKDLRDKLLETGEAKLVEHTVKDSYWADGGDGSGKNMLGKLLMKLRDELGKK
jgi:ribA/ribD-fused uncharacterized protein